MKNEKKILKLADTRWFALYQCIVCIHDCWESLTNLFRIAVFEDKLKSAEIILNELNYPFIKSYFRF